MLTEKEKQLIETVKANWSPLSIPGELIKIIERLTNPPVEPRPARSERAFPPRGKGEMGQ